MQVVRSLAFVIWLYGVLLVLGIVFLPAMLAPRRFVRVGMRWWAAATRWGLRTICGITTEVRGLENLPQGACIVAAKHQCMYDTISPFEWLRDPAFVLKKELMFLPILGWYAWKADMIAIDRSGAVKTLKNMIKRAREETANDRQLIIFPEGTRGPPGAPPDYKPGVAALYTALDLPCTPVALNTGLCWPAHGFLRRPGRIVFEVLPAIPPGLDRKSFMAQLEQTIETASGRLLDEGRAVQDELGVAPRAEAPAE